MDVDLYFGMHQLRAKTKFFKQQYIRFAGICPWK